MIPLTTSINTRNIHILHSAFSISSVPKSEEFCSLMKITLCSFCAVMDFSNFSPWHASINAVPNHKTTHRYVLDLSRLFMTKEATKYYQESELIQRAESNIREYELFYWLWEEISIDRSWSLAGSCHSLD